MDAALTEAVKAKFVALDPLFDERLRRRWAAVEARGIGRGGIARVAAATGMSRTTIRAGVQELTAQEASGAEDDPGRVRRRGAGRKRLTAHDPSLEQALERLVDPVTRGDPMGPLRWTCSSAARLVTELQAQGHAVSERTGLRRRTGRRPRDPHDRMGAETHRDAPRNHLRPRTRRGHSAARGRSRPPPASRRGYHCGVEQFATGPTAPFYRALVEEHQLASGVSAGTNHVGVGNRGDVRNWRRRCCRERMPTRLGACSMRRSPSSWQPAPTPTAWSASAQTPCSTPCATLESPSKKAERARIGRRVPQ